MARPPHLRRGAPLLVEPDTGWRRRAACLGTGQPELFWPDDGYATEAKTICNGTPTQPPCPVREQCLGYAVSTGQTEGIWGGLSPAEREHLHHRGRVAV